MRSVIIDGYVDEPACLGVPPYISPYPRYIAGAMIDAGAKPRDVHYYTIDQLRAEPRIIGIMDRADLIVVVAGLTVPGRYLNAKPITIREVGDFIARYNEKILVGGPIRLSHESVLRSEYVAEKDLEARVFDRLTEKSETDRWRRTSEIKRWSVKGAQIIQRHPYFPHIMCEIETYRGCPRERHCSFCTEPLYPHSTREIDDVVDEVRALYESGARYFRIGRQPDLFSYKRIETNSGFKPDPTAIEKLYRGIRRAAPKLRVLHMDNLNPATIIEYPDESREIAKTIIKYHTPGDVAAMGVESSDPRVIRENNLQIYPEDVIKAVELINEVGSMRGENGLPELLPGINLLYGLKGESKRTYQHNLELLQRIHEKGLLLRRINIRKAMRFKETPLGETKVHIEKKLFYHHRETIKRRIEVPMLREIAPEGTIIREILTEAHDGRFTLGRQIASYPLLIRIEGILKLGVFMDVAVTGHSHRSLTAIPVERMRNIEVGSEPTHRLSGY
ncbi:hypothetical protein FHEFKHOI_01305 [Candidatus Methanoperedenaceae archaeon GB50]|nr:hypothetical protein FHEFKHOI_01305 [Candidatus Methanoperedenaceae archaeon GB50]CAD7781029.1 MAG: hypothetical protein KBONHNOK_01565 [Candidatus Methanoperedenaceae archaeon GB50]